MLNPGLEGRKMGGEIGLWEKGISKTKFVLQENVFFYMTLGPISSLSETSVIFFFFFDFYRVLGVE